MDILQREQPDEDSDSCFKTIPKCMYDDKKDVSIRTA
jgi:hypothetical protein